MFFSFFHCFVAPCFICLFLNGHHESFTGGWNEVCLMCLLLVSRYDAVFVVHFSELIVVIMQTVNSFHYRIGCLFTVVAVYFPVALLLYNSL